MTDHVVPPYAMLTPRACSFCFECRVSFPLYKDSPRAVRLFIAFHRLPSLFIEHPPMYFGAQVLEDSLIHRVVSLYSSNVHGNFNYYLFRGRPCAGMDSQFFYRPRTLQLSPLVFVAISPINFPCRSHSRLFSEIQKFTPTKARFSSK